MATQGSIAIWNYSKLVSKFPEIENNASLKEIIGGDIHPNPFNKGEQLLISYDGDNLNSPTGYYPDYEPENWVRSFDLKSLQKKKAIQLLKFLNEKCLVADWCIWD